MYSGCPYGTRAGVPDAALEYLTQRWSTRLSSGIPDAALEYLTQLLSTWRSFGVPDATFRPHYRLLQGIHTDKLLMCVTVNGVSFRDKHACS